MLSNSAPNFTDAELDDIRSLHGLFSELDLAVVKIVYERNDRDYRQSQEALGDLAKNPSAVSQLLLQQLPVSIHQGNSMRPDAPPGHAQAEGRTRGDHYGVAGAAGATGLAALAMAPPPKDDNDNDTLIPGLPAFDVNSLAETLTQVGATVTDSISNFAVNLTGWMADLASALDSGWGDEVEEQRVVRQTSDKDAPAVGYGTSLGIDRPYQRRLGTQQSSTEQRQQARPPADLDPEDEDDWEDEEEDDKDD